VATGSTDAPLLAAATPWEWLATHLTSDPDVDGAPEPAWVGVDELLAGQAAHLRRCHARLVAEDGATPQAAAKWLTSWTAGQLADAVGFTYAAASAALLVRPGRARFGLDGGGYPDRVDPGPVGIAVSIGHPWAGQAGVEVVIGEPELATTAVEALVAASEPVVTACRGLARVGRPGLWAEVADGFGLAVLSRSDLPVAGEVVERIRRAVRTTGCPWRRVPDLRVAPTRSGPAYLGRKGGCCLSYQCRPVEPQAVTAGERAFRTRFPCDPGEPRYCSTCSLRDLSGCEQRQVFWVEHERAQRSVRQPSCADRDTRST